MPTAARYRGKRVRVVQYEGHGRWLIVDHEDQQRVVHRDSLTFTKESKK